MHRGPRTTMPRPRWRTVLSLRADETGATAMEYGLIAALIALAILAGVKTLGANLVGLPLHSIITAIQSVV